MKNPTRSAAKTISRARRQMKGESVWLKLVKTTVIPEKHVVEAKWQDGSYGQTFRIGWRWYLVADTSRIEKPVVFREWNPPRVRHTVHA